MADFVQTMKDWKRMCNAMGQEDEYTACDKCDLQDFGCPAIYEKECDSADWKHVERVVAKWAAEHPEPKYPTWAEWLLKVGAARRVPIGEPWPVEFADGSMLEPCYEIVVKENEPIPADLAQKLGIEPKEG